MKITLVSDIHGNLPALEAVLRHAHARQAGGTILNMGDSIGYGPFPDEVVQTIQGVQFTNILGDYDRKVLDKSHRKEGWAKVKPPDKRKMFAWTCQALSKKSRQYLKTLPKETRVEIGGRSILLTHGSPDSHGDHLHPDTPEQRFRELATQATAEIILCGHAHQPMVKTVDSTWFINPGSVGRLDDGDPRASYATLEIKDKEISVEHFRVPYDIMQAVHRMRLTGLPEIFTQVLRQGLNYDDVVARFGQSPGLTAPEPCGTLTLLTDFGLKDHFVGVMKGVITGIAPQTRLIDISHQIRPQNVAQAARMLAEAVPYFPAGTAHVAVVDPGVGTARRAIAAQIGDHFFVSPDNGLLTALIEEAEANGETVRIIDLDQPKYWLPNPSHSFHGRDIFSPVGAHLVNGIPLETLGTLISDLVRLDLPQPMRTPDGWETEVVMVDGFGNLSTNLTAGRLPEDWVAVSLEIHGKVIQGITQAFGDAAPGSLIATVDSTNSLAISVVNGSAEEHLLAKPGDKVFVKYN